MLTIDSRSDPRSQKLVIARAATIEGGFVKLVVHPDTLANIDRQKQGRYDRLGQFCGLVHGNVWAATGEEHYDEGTPGLTRPVAIFRGLHRARNLATDDNETVIYITNPGRNYVYLEENVLTGGPTRCPVPPNAVFATYVDYGPEAVDTFRREVAYPAPRDTAGVVVDWEWVRASPSDPRLPVNSMSKDSRYTQKIWDERDE